MRNLNGMMLVRCFRVLDMMALSFDDHYDTYNEEKGEYEEKYGIHFLCWLRAVYQNRIIVSSNDSLVDRNGNYIDESEHHSESLYDEEMNHILESLHGIVIQEIVLLPEGDLKILFSNGFKIEAFVKHSNSENDEDWLLLDFVNNVHISVSGGAIDIYFGEE